MGVVRSFFRGLLVSVLATGVAQGAVIFTNLVAFNGTNGANSQATLIQGSDGSLYGTTVGNWGTLGTVFRVTLDGTLGILHVFDDLNEGACPQAELTETSDGSFYGSTCYGGGNEAGIIFRVTTSSNFTTVLAFDGTNGALPIARLIMGNDGNFYGTTYSGGLGFDGSVGSGKGTVFRLTTNGILTTLVLFDGLNGKNPAAPLLSVADGSFYGTTYNGGTNNFGTVFKITPDGTLVPVYSFNGPDGSFPAGALVPDGAGNLYGTTTFGGEAYDRGTIFKINAAGELITLFRFPLDEDYVPINGAEPRGTLLRARDGNFYGTTRFGGTNFFAGIIFRFGADGSFTPLHFLTGPGGSQPMAGLLQALDGTLYGTTCGGGPGREGTVFRISVPMPPVIQMPARNGNEATITWSAVAGQSYQLQCNSILDSTNWIDLGIPITATNGTMTASDALGLEPQRFYRVALLP